VAIGDVAAVVNDAWPFISAAVAGYGAAVLRISDEAAAEATVTLGRRILQRVFGRGMPPQALTDLAADPQDSDLQAALRVTLRKLLAEDSELTAQIRDMLAGTRVVTSNVIRGSIVHGPVIQVGVITGEVTLPGS
jgi:hypothetical protein